MLTAVAEGDRRPLANGVEHHGERRQPSVDGRSTSGADGPATGRLAVHAQLIRACLADRLAEVDPGDGHVEGGLLLGLQPEVGEVVGVGIDAVPELVLPFDGNGQDGHPFVAQQPLVPLERLTTGAVAVGIAGHPVGDLSQAQGAAGVEEHQQQVGDSFEAVESGHSGQFTVPPRGG